MFHDKSMDKRTFITSVRNWEAEAVKSALAREATLALYVDQTGKTPLHHCAGINPLEAKLSPHNAVKTARALIDAGADVNAVRIIIDDGQEFAATPLWYAVAWGKNVELVQFLLEHGAHPDTNAVRSAIWDQNLRMAALLHCYGADIDPVVGDETPLLQNVRSKRLKLLTWLIENGADLNFQDSQGYSPLHYAVRRGYNLAQIGDLLHHGAKPTLKAKNGSTPLSLAREQGKAKLVALLQSADPAGE